MGALKRILVLMFLLRQSRRQGIYKREKRWSCFQNAFSGIGTVAANEEGAGDPSVIIVARYTTDAQEDTPRVYVQIV